MTAPLDDLPDLDELDRLAAAATPGPWEANPASGLHDDAAAWVGYDSTGTGPQTFICSTANHPDGLNDAAFIAASRSALPLLVARVRELEAQLDHQKSTAAGLRRVQSETVERLRQRTDERDALRDGITKLADWFDSEPNWREWRIGSQIRSLLTTGELDASSPSGNLASKLPTDNGSDR
jgi:hypothetical protein